MPKVCRHVGAEVSQGLLWQVKCRGAKPEYGRRSSRSWQTSGPFNYRRALQNPPCEAVQRDLFFLLSHNSSPKRLPIIPASY